MGKKFMRHDLRRTFITAAERLKIEHYALKAFAQPQQQQRRNRWLYRH